MSMDNDQLKNAAVMLKSGEYDGTHVMTGWIACRELIVAQDRIASLEAQLKEREWISVDKEFPPKSTAFSTHSVLLWDSHQPVYPYTTGHGVMTGNNGVNIPYTISHYVDDRGNHLRPTHWMPLPSPPKEQES